MLFIYSYTVDRLFTETEQTSKLYGFLNEYKIAFVKDEWLLEVDIKLNLLAVTFPPFSNTNEASNKRFSRIPTCKKYGEKKIIK